jgi:hypothetical protein
MDTAGRILLREPSGQFDDLRLDVSQTTPRRRRGTGGDSATRHVREARRAVRGNPSGWTDVGEEIMVDGMIDGICGSRRAP